MKIDLEKIKEVYGEDTLYDIKDNIEDVIDNLSTLAKHKFENIYEILELNPQLFLLSPDIFEEKLELLIKKLGVEYIEKLDNDFSLWGEMDD